MPSSLPTVPHPVLMVTHCVQNDCIDPNDVQALRDEIEDLQINLCKVEEEKVAYTSEREVQTKLVYV